MQHVPGWFCKPRGGGRGEGRRAWGPSYCGTRPSRGTISKVYSQSLALNPVALMHLKENQAGVIQDLDETLPRTFNPFIHEAIT